MVSKLKFILKLRYFIGFCLKYMFAHYKRKKFICFNFIVHCFHNNESIALFKTISYSLAAIRDLHKIYCIPNPAALVSAC